MAARGRRRFAFMRHSASKAVNGGEGFELACVLEAGEGGGALECLAQHVDALDSILATAMLVGATECVAGQAAKAVDG